MHYEQQLANAHCSHPFAYLGPKASESGISVRAWIPGAESVSLVAYGSDTVLAEMSSEAPGLFFAASVSLCEGDIYEFAVRSGEHRYRVVDPYQFSEHAYHGVHFIDHAPENLYRQGGAQRIQIATQGHEVPAIRFVVYAPNASAVSVIGDFNFWDGRCHPMQKTDLGYWVLVIPQLSVGTKYKYELKDAGGNALPHKADPLGFFAEPYPSHASVVYDHDAYQWNDAAWMSTRQQDVYHQPIAIYEVHLGSWKRPTDANQRYLSYRELAVDLVDYVKTMGYSHIELLPVSEYPFDGSWGYQPVGLFAPTSRFGSPDDFKFFVDHCHQQGIGVIIDWVPAHFPEDAHGLARFDGSHVYEYADPRRGWHPDWNSCIYDFGKDTVRQFLVANALFWLDKFHVDGLRVDAVASMLYLDYSRNHGEWIPNIDGGNQNYEAISLLRWMNQAVYEKFPSAITIAEESTSFPKVSRPIYEGGLGFGFKWNMGWMHDSLHYISKDPAYRRYHHNDITFSMVYAFHENFVLPISHDEVVHGKGSLLNKMPGDEWQQAANLRLYAAFMYGHPGKKLNFMGNELGQGLEWNHDKGLDWYLLEFPKHKGIQALYRKLNHLYASHPALYDNDHAAQGFRWIDHTNADQSVLVFERRSIHTQERMIVICNFTPIVRHDYRVGVENEGQYRLVLNTDDTAYWGSGADAAAVIDAQEIPWHGSDYSISTELPALSTLYYHWEA